MSSNIETSWLAQRGAPGRIAAVSQFSSLGATGALNLALLAHNSATLALYASITAPGLLLLGAVDPGLNQEYALSGGLRRLAGGKAMLLLAAPAVTFAFGVQVADLNYVLAASVYVVCFIFFTGALARTWRLSLYRSEVAAKLTLSTGALVLMFGTIDCSRELTILIVLYGQAIVMGLLCLTIISATRGEDISYVTDDRQFAHFLRSSVVRALPLDILSNGIFLAAATTGASSAYLAQLRVGTLVAVAAIAVLPVGVQHYFRWNPNRRRRIQRTLRVGALGFSAAWILSVCFHVGVSAALGFAGISAGLLVAALNFAVSAAHVSSRLTIAVAGSSIGSLAIACLAAEFNLGPDKVVLSAAVSAIMVFTLVSRSTPWSFHEIPPPPSLESD